MKERATARSTSMRGRDDHTIRLAHFPGDSIEEARAFVRAALAETGGWAVLEIELGFDPSADVEQLEDRALCARVETRGRARWALVIQPAGCGEILDLRQLEAPLPLEGILEASARLAPGASLLARTPALPRLLFPHLDRRGLDWEAAETADRTALVWVGRPL